MTESISDLGERAERLVQSKLEQLGFEVAPMGPRAHDYDMVAVKGEWKLSVQVKASRFKDPQIGNVTKFLKIDIINEPDEHVRQYVRGPRALKHPGALWVWVLLLTGEEPTYSLMLEKDVQDITHQLYDSWLKSHGNERPRNPYSLHSLMPYKELEKRKNNWPLLNELKESHAKS
jgi:hypothetical protein